MSASLIGRSGSSAFRLRSALNRTISASTLCAVLVCTKNLNPDIVVMKSAKDRVRSDASGPLNRARDRRIFVQGTMRSDVVVITSVGLQDAAQMRLVQDDQMIHALSPDRSDQPLGKAILPGRGRCDGFIPDAHGANSAHDHGTINAIPIAHEVAWHLIPGKCLGQLARDPFSRRVCRDVNPTVERKPNGVLPFCYPNSVATHDKKRDVVDGGAKILRENKTAKN